MAELENSRVPQKIREDLQTLSGLDLAQMEALARAIDDSKPTINPHDFAHNVEQELEAGQLPEIYSLVRTILSLCSAVQDGYVEVSDFIARVFESEVNFSEDQRGLLENRLANLLNHDSVIITSKAHNVMSSHQSVYLESKILTDIRPIFKKNGNVDSEEKQWAASVIVHSLELTYRDGEESKQFFIALDNEDISKLSKQLQSAQEKTQELKKVLGRLDVPYIEVNYEQPSKSRSR